MAGGHLRFLLIYSPRWLFLYPGLFLTLFGVAVMAVVLPGPLTVQHVVFDVHTLMIAMGAILLGIQLISFFLLAKQFAINEKLLPLGPNFAFYRNHMSLERAALAGVLLIMAGLLGTIATVMSWGSVDFGHLDSRKTMRLLIPSLTALLAGIQVIITGFMSSILDLKLRK